MSSYREQMKDFPVKQMVVVSLIRFSEPLAFTSLFPYLYFMIRDFQIAPTEQEISKYSGYLASSFAFFQFLFALQWGKLLNRIGRKPILLFGLFGSSVSLVLFGFSPNYYFALASRCLAGALNGNIAVLRTMVGEICVERRHQAIGFSTLPLLFNFGSIIGPLIGGSRLFTNPKQESPYHRAAGNELVQQTLASAYFRFRDRHPYALSNMVVSIFLSTSMVIGFLFLEETNEDFKDRRDIGLELGDALSHAIFGGEKRIRPWNTATAAEDPETAPLLGPAPHEPLRVASGSDPAGSSNMREYDPNYTSSEGTLPNTSGAASLKSQRMVDEAPGLAQEPPILTPQVITVIASNCIISLHNVAYNEFLPVFLAARFQKDTLQFPFRIAGGFGLDTSYIGTLFSSTGIMGMLIILVVFPVLDRKLGTLNGFRLSLVFFPVVYACVPLTIFTLHKYNPAFPAWVTPTLLYAMTSMKTLASATGMPQVMVLNHRAAAKKHRAYVNSLTMSMLALSRSVGPIIFGYLMSMGDRHGRAWFSWWSMAALATFGLLQSFRMQDHDD